MTHSNKRASRMWEDAIYTTMQAMWKDGATLKAIAATLATQHNYHISPMTVKGFMRQSPHDFPKRYVGWHLKKHKNGGENDTD